MDRALLALCALALNAAFAGPRSIYAALGISSLFRVPVKLLREFERRLNREHRSDRQRELRGIVLVAAVVAASFLLGWLCQWLFLDNLGFFELLIVALLLPVRPSWDIVSGIRKHLQAGDANAARLLLEGTAWRHHALLDAHGAARAGIELLAVHFAEKIVSPVLWYILLGLPGLFTARALAFLREHMQQPAGTEQSFTKAAWQLHALISWPGAQIAALLWIGVSLFLPSARWRQAAQTVGMAMVRTQPRYLILLSAASVLNLSLGGPGSAYAAGVWIGTGHPRASAADLKRALILFALLHLLLFVLLGLFFL